MTPIIDSAKRYGQHYTPTELARFLASRALSHVNFGVSNIVIVDPACGDGELLLAVAHYLAIQNFQGNVSLRGYDIDKSALNIARERLNKHGLDVELIHGNFLEHQRKIEAGSIDLIITNPPYVRTQQLGSEFSRILSEEFNLSGRVDLTHPFVSVAPRLLSDNGTFALLCSNRFLTTLAGANVRQVLTGSSLSIRELYDLGDTKLFKAAVLPAIIVATKAPVSDTPVHYSSAYQIPQTTLATTPLFEALTGPVTTLANHDDKTFEVRVGTFTAPADTKTPWRLSEPDSDIWLEEIEQKKWKSFGEIAKVRVGIKTTADKVFLHNDWQSHAPEVEHEVLLPLITQANITPWAISDDLKMRVLYPYDLEKRKRTLLDMDSLPGTMSYLRSHEAQLSGRTYVIKGGREWFEIWVPQKPSLWSIPKIVFPDISEFPRFALDTTGAVVNGNCYWISLEDIGNLDLAYLMIAVANSALGTRFYDETCGNKLYSGKRRWMSQYVNRIPVPNPNTVKAQELVAFAKSIGTSGIDSNDQIMQLNSLVTEAFAASTPENTPPDHLF